MLLKQDSAFAFHRPYLALCCFGEASGSSGQHVLLVECKNTNNANKVVLGDPQFAHGVSALMIKYYGTGYTSHNMKHSEADTIYI